MYNRSSQILGFNDRPKGSICQGGLNRTASRAQTKLGISKWPQIWGRVSKLPLTRTHVLSKRGAEVANIDMVTFMKLWPQAADNLWSDDNPKGGIILALAENFLSSDLMLERINQCKPMPQSWMGYRAHGGDIATRMAFINMLKQTSILACDIQPENILLCNGLTPMLNSLAWVLSDQGDTCIIPAPYYPVFDNDLLIRNNIQRHAWNLDYQNNIGQQLDCVKYEIEQKGGRVSMFLLTNPNNPTGTVHSEQTILQILTWCVENKVHLISDEVYASSIFGQDTESPSFQSTADVAKRATATGGPLSGPQIAPLVWQYVHVLSAVSKDWCGSGLRIGALVSWSTEVLAAMGNMVQFKLPSNQTQWCIAEIFQDNEFIQTFIQENKRRLTKQYTLLTEQLDQADIPYVPTTAGLFTLVNLRSALREDSWDGERELVLRAYDDQKLIMTPGSKCHTSEPGHCRVCFARVPPPAIVEAGRRLRQLVSNSRNT